MIEQTIAEKFDTTEERHLGRFVEVYLQSGGNMREAAIAAGYSPNSADQGGAKCLAHPMVSAEITRWSTKPPKESEATQQEAREVIKRVERAILRAARTAREQIASSEDQLKKVDASMAEAAAMAIATKDRSQMPHLMAARAAKRAEIQGVADEAKLAWPALLRSYRQVSDLRKKALAGEALQRDLSGLIAAYFLTQYFGDDEEMRAILDREIGADKPRQSYLMR